MTSISPPAPVRPTITRWTTSSLNASGDNLFAPASSSAPRLLCAAASGAHSKRANADGSFANRSTAFSLLNRPGIEISALANHLVRQHHHRRRKRDAEGLGSLQIDDQLEERRPFERKVGRLRA